MASADNPYSYRETPQNDMTDPFDLQQCVMSMAAELPYYWPDYNAEMTQAVLQDPNVEDGTYILRPSGNVDIRKRKLLTLSIKMDFPKEPTKVWHFPVIISVDENGGESAPVAHFSLTQTSNTPSNQITSLADLLEYHHHRPLKGGRLPHICKVVKGLVYKNKEKEGRQRDDSFDQLQSRVVYELNPIESDGTEEAVNSLPALTISESPSVAPTAPTVPAQVNNLKTQSQKRHRPPSPQPPPRSKTLPHATPAPPVNRRGPQPAPRKTSESKPNSSEPSAPQPITRRPKPISISDTSSSSSHESLDVESRSSGGSSKFNPEESPKMCQCGLPLDVTYLPKFWSVHRSTSQDTLHMLYFRNPAGQTAWALPPHIDKECPNRNYLHYGRLNVSCFQQYATEMTYVSGSELSNWSNYSTYNQRNS